jgi:hypothetical protein
MKIIISEKQYKRLFEQEQKVFHIPDLKYVGGWDNLQELIKLKGNPPYSIGGILYLAGTSIKDLGNLQSVGGILYLGGTPIESLGNLQSVGGTLDLSRTPIESLGNLQSVGGDLDLQGTKIKSLGNLQSVGNDLDLRGVPISKMYSEKQIRQMVNVEGKIYL